jgi:hypothetical protein
MIARIIPSREQVEHDHLIAKFNDPYDTIKKVRYLIELSQRKAARYTGVDATKFHEFVHDQKLDPGQYDNVVFQCPWILDKGGGQLMRDVVQSVAKVQQNGQFLFFGLTDHETWKPLYELEKLKPVVEQFYERIEDDNFIIKHAYKSYGYRHISNSGKGVNH